MGSDEGQGVGMGRLDHAHIRRIGVRVRRQSVVPIRPQVRWRTHIRRRAGVIAVPAPTGGLIGAAAAQDQRERVERATPRRHVTKPLPREDPGGAHDAAPYPPVEFILG